MNATATATPRPAHSGSPRSVHPAIAVSRVLEDLLRNELLHARLRGSVPTAKIVTGIFLRLKFPVFPVHTVCSVAHESEPWQAVIERHVVCIVSGSHLVDASLKSSPEFVGTDYDTFIPKVVRLTLKSFFRREPSTESFGPIAVDYRHQPDYLSGRRVEEWRVWQESAVDAVVDRLTAAVLYRMKK